MAAVLLPVLAGTISVAREAYAHTVTQAYDAADVAGSRAAGAIRQSLQQRELEVTALSVPGQRPSGGVGVEVS